MVMKYPTINGEILDFVIDDEELDRFGVYHGEKVESPYGEAIIVGTIDGKLWLHYDMRCGAEKTDCLSHSDLRRYNIRRVKEMRSITHPSYFKLRDKFPDVTLTVDEVEFCVHRCVLASVSDYFQTMFSSNVGMSGVIDGVDSKTFEEIVTFAYTNTIVIHENNFMSLINACEMFLILDLKKKCVEYLHNLDCSSFLECFKDLKQIAPSECIGYIRANWDVLIEWSVFYDIVNSDKEFQKQLYKSIPITSPNSSSICEEDRRRVVEYFQAMSKKCPTITDLKFNKADDVRKICDGNGVPIPLWYRERYGRFFKHDA